MDSKMKVRLVGYRKALVALLMVTVLGACRDDREVFGEYRPSDAICFTASLSADAQAVHSRGGVPYLDFEEEVWKLEETSSDGSRAAVQSVLNGLEVGVVGNIHGSDGAYKSTLMLNQKYEFVNNEDLQAEGTPPLWKNVPDSDTLQVYSYAPYVDITTSTNFSVTNTGGEPVITYTVPEAVAAQTDIIASDLEKVPGDYDQYIPLTYNHILTGIRFKAGFECKVKSIAIQNVNGKGNYALRGTWSGQTGSSGTLGSDSYNIEFSDGKDCSVGTMITDENSIFMMIPQQLPETAKVVLTYGDGQTVTASLKGMKWEPGKLITYTINKNATSSTGYVYFDLYAGNVTIEPDSYSGYVYVNGEPKLVTGNGDTSIMKFYVYQSTAMNKSNTGWATEIGDAGGCRIPSYNPVMVGERFWSDYITNNKVVEDVIEKWDTEDGLKADANKSSTEGLTGAVREVGRSSTPYWINVTSGTNLTIDNLYSRKQMRSVGRTEGGIAYKPQSDNSTLTINIVGDNRFGCIHYFSGSHTVDNKTVLFKNNQLVLQGSGSLTLACVDFYKGMSDQSAGTDNQTGDIGNNHDNINGYYSNFWCSAIGGNDGSQGNALGIVVNGGTIFAGTTQAENCTAIGGGGNDRGDVTIKGGTVTAVSTSTGTAIGGGIGFRSGGGTGNVIIEGGNVYAYNHANEWEIPSAAIGSAGSWKADGGAGYVEIKGGYVYAETALGTAIGGGSSKLKNGGKGEVKISGGYVIAKSIASIDKTENKEYPPGNGIGGGTGGTDGNGGEADITISSSAYVRTGSIGGGKTNKPDGNIGHAKIEVSGGDISAQFILAGGATKKSEFEMTGGVIRNSNVHDKEYYHTQKYGGAVYLEDGTFAMSGDAKILNCTGDIGGAVYIKKSNNSQITPTFTMSGGYIENCVSKRVGGAVYLEGGEVTLSGGTIQKNLASNGSGGAVYIKAGNFYMPADGNATIQNNSALRGGNGGGIYVTSASSDVIVDILSGTITGNSCDGNGGGVCVDMADNDTNSAIVRIGENGSTSETNPSITNNAAVMYGGGLYAIGAKADITINGGIIEGNKVPNYVPNLDVANEGGTVTLNGGKVDHKVVTFDANADGDESVENMPAPQRIVTNTNSKLVVPATNPTRNYYKFVKWNRRKDGLDTESITDGMLMNIKENLTLYAIWERQ